MLLQLKDVVALESANRFISELLKTYQEWFLAENGSAPIAVANAELDFSINHRRFIFTSLGARGVRSWRITAWHWSGEKLLLEATRRMGSESAILQLIPRASAKAIVAGIAAARQARCEQLAHLVSEAIVSDFIRDDSTMPQWQASEPQPKHHRERYRAFSAKIERATLSPGMRRDQPGRYARIILRLTDQRTAVTATVAGTDVRNVDALFSSALLWFNRLQRMPKRPCVEQLLLVVEHHALEAARQRHVLLRDSLRSRIELWEVDEDWRQVSKARAIDRKMLWRKRVTRLPPVMEAGISESAQRIASLSAQAIDLVKSRHGETLRYHGLPFARVRRLMNTDRIWFGIDGSRRRSLNKYHERDWTKLFADLSKYRRGACRDRRHWYYRAAGEAWLESILRRDITKLDPGLIIAPLHVQFRTASGGPTGARPIDLLALRHDGRLVVIELKVNEDREHVFQGVDYWRRVEAHRRRGHISAAKLFGDRAISDDSPLVYLVAPALRFHPSFKTLARMIAADIEIYRFDINENWRQGVRVVRRERVNE